MKYHNFSPRLAMWYVEAQSEKNIYFFKIARAMRLLRRPKYAIYPKSLYKQIELYDHTKTIDYCFIGSYSIDQKTQKNRKWILDFIANKFTASSYLQFTDTNTKKNYTPFGTFDYTLKRDGFVPKETSIKMRNTIDVNYFKNLAKSKFTLCPAGDESWSMRFYEALMCKSIPIVSCKNETFRSEAEEKLPYKYYLATDNHIYREDWTSYNHKIFLKYHTLEYRWW